MTVSSRPPLSCNLSALNPEQRARHAQLWKEVRTLTMPDAFEHGIAFRLEATPTLAQTVAELASLERLCCPFLTLTMTFTPAGGPLLFELTGDREVQAVLAAEFGTTRRAQEG